jgi:chromosome partitioning protein
LLILKKASKITTVQNFYHSSIELINMATKSELLLVPESLADVMTQADKASYMMNAVRGALLAPENRKQAPHFNTTELAALCDADRSQIVYRSSKGDLPPGTINPGGNRRTFTLEDAMPWIREFRADQLRPKGAHAVCISVANFKGGVGKTTTAMTLAQGLALKGHKVLVLDCDPQGSLTTLFGILPDTEVDESQTILPVCLGQESSIAPFYSEHILAWPGSGLRCSAPLRC